jgi:hypothetical protein
MADGDLVVVHTYSSQPEAALAQSALAAAGIESMVQADSVGGMRPHVAWASGGFKVLVREEDEEEARDILELPAKPA